MKYIIEVYHQTGIRTYEAESFWDSASWDLTLTTYTSIEDAEKMFDDNIPEELLELLKEGEVVEISEERFNDYYLLKDFDKEAYARDYLAQDLHMLIDIETVEEAEYYATQYKGHEWIKVRVAAREILEKLKEENK